MTRKGAEIRVVTRGWGRELNDLCRIRLEQLCLKQNVSRIWDEAFGHAIGCCGHGHGKTEKLVLGAWLGDDDVVWLWNGRMGIIEGKLHFLASFDFEFLGVISQRVCEIWLDGDFSQFSTCC